LDASNSALTLLILLIKLCRQVVPLHEAAMRANSATVWARFLTIEGESAAVLYRGVEMAFP